MQSQWQWQWGYWGCRPCRHQPAPGRCHGYCTAAPADTRTSATSTRAARAPLDPPTIHTLQECIRALLPPQLAAFSRAFRSAFQVPDAIPSIAGLITEHRHQLWIQRYLGQPIAS